MTARARVGVVGAGWWSSFAHLPAIAEHPDAELTVVADRDEQRARSAADLFGATLGTASLDAVLAAELDAAVVATPQGEHFAAASALLDAGVDVLVEKPLATDAAEAWELVRRAKRAGARLHVGHTFLHSPAVQHLRTRVLDGRLGQLHMVSALFATAVAGLYAGETAFAQADTAAPFAPRGTTYSDPASGGQLFTQLSHAIAVVLFVTGGTPREVAAFEERHGLAVDLSDVVIARMDSNAIASFATTGAIGQNDLRLEEYRFVGSDGHALLDTVAGTLEVTNRGKALEQKTFAQPELSREPVRNLIDAAFGRSPVVATGELGARVVDTLTAARRASRDAATIEVRRTGVPDDRAAGGRPPSSLDCAR